MDDQSSAEAAKVKKTIKKTSGGVTENTVAEGTATAATKVKKTKKKMSINNTKTGSKGSAAEATGAKKPKKKKASPKVVGEALPEGTRHVIGPYMRYLLEVNCGGSS